MSWETNVTSAQSGDYMRLDDTPAIRRSKPTCGARFWSVCCAPFNWLCGTTQKVATIKVPNPMAPVTIALQSPAAVATSQPNQRDRAIPFIDSPDSKNNSSAPSLVSDALISTSTSPKSDSPSHQNALPSQPCAIHAFLVALALAHPLSLASLKRAPSASTASPKNPALRGAC